VGRGRTRSSAIFLGGFVSVALSATLALTELLISASALAAPAGDLRTSFLASGLIEGPLRLRRFAPSSG